MDTTEYKIISLKSVTKKDAKYFANYCEYCKKAISKIGKEKVYVLFWRETDTYKNRFSNNEHLFTETDLIKKLNEFITRKEA